MSVIENALQKLRRAGGVAGAPHTPLHKAMGAHAPHPISPVDLGSFTGRRIAVDFSRLRSAGYLPESGQERLFADCYREIKRPVIQRAVAVDAPEDQRLIMITSALPGEGKTFTSVNLALSIAREQDVSVLLVDADLAKSEVSRIFGVYGEPGLLDALSEEAADAESLVVRTDLPGLEILSSGAGASTAAAAERAAELIASSRMAQIAARLSHRNSRRLIVFDSPPVLVSSEARALAHVPGQVLLVTRSGQTPQQALLDAIASIDKNRLQGLVLNDAHLAIGSGYYYGYGYSRSELKRDEGVASNAPPSTD